MSILTRWLVPEEIRVTQEALTKSGWLERRMAPHGSQRELWSADHRAHLIRASIHLTFSPIDSGIGRSICCDQRIICMPMHAMTDATLKQIQSRQRVSTAGYVREDHVHIDCSQRTEMLPYSGRVLLQIEGRTVATASRSPAPAVCTPALQAKRSPTLRVRAWY